MVASYDGIPSMLLAMKSAAQLKAWEMLFVVVWAHARAKKPTILWRLLLSENITIHSLTGSKEMTFAHTLYMYYLSRSRRALTLCLYSIWICINALVAPNRWHEVLPLKIICLTYQQWLHQNLQDTADKNDWLRDKQPIRLIAHEIHSPQDRPAGLMGSWKLFRAFNGWTCRAVARYCHKSYSADIQEKYMLRLYNIALRSWERLNHLFLQTRWNI